ncbi:MAG: di/tricarboxylate transporter [Pseudohongiellaceae bacterium]|jgi:di/tricarboxylate transporter
MELHGWIALAVLIVAAILFLTRRLPLEATALGIPVVLFATGTVPDPSIALQGFGNQAVIAIAAVCVMGAGLQESGVAALMSRWAQRLGGRSEARLMVVLCVAVAGLSAFMSNAAAVAVFLPSVMGLSRSAGIAPSRLLMPLGFSAVLGGNITVIGTASNLLIGDFLHERAGHAPALFDFALVGLPLAIAGILYLLLIGRHLLPKSKAQGASQGAAGKAARHAPPEQLAQAHGLSRNLTRLRLGKASLLANHSLADLNLGQRYGISVVMVARHRGLVLHWRVPTTDLVLQQGDDLYLDGDSEAIWQLAEDNQTRMGLAGEHHVEHVLDHGVALAEAMVGPRSKAVGTTLRELRFRQVHKLSVVNICRGESRHTQRLGQLPLAVGDTLLLAGSRNGLRLLSMSDDFVVLTDVGESHDSRKTPLALALMALALVPPMLGWAPLAMSALAAALLMALTGCVSVREAGRHIEWKVLALIVGTLPLGYALDVHGVANHAALALTAMAQHFGPEVLLGVLFVGAAVVSTVSSNAAAAVILAPVAVRAAEHLSSSPRAALLAVAYGCSCAFVVPFANPCNLMVAAPGGYSTRDFIKIGGGLSIVVCLVAVTALSLFVL